jgi:hypothetical protein
MAAQRLADIAVRSRFLAIMYVVMLFYVIPAFFAVVGQIFG